VDRKLLAASPSAVVTSSPTDESGGAFPNCQRGSQWPFLSAVTQTCILTKWLQKQDSSASHLMWLLP